MPDLPVPDAASDPVPPACLTDAFMQARHDGLTPRAFRLSDSLYRLLLQLFGVQQINGLFGVLVENGGKCASFLLANGRGMRRYPIIADCYGKLGPQLPMEPPKEEA